jgi:hypothetical protein
MSATAVFHTVSPHTLPPDAWALCSRTCPICSRYLAAGQERTWVAANVRASHKQQDRCRLMVMGYHRWIRWKLPSCLRSAVTRAAAHPPTPHPPGRHLRGCLVRMWQQLAPLVLDFLPPICPLQWIPICIHQLLICPPVTLAELNPVLPDNTNSAAYKPGSEPQVVISWGSTDDPCGSGGGRMHRWMFAAHTPP